MQFLRDNRRHLSTAALLFGFILDNLTLKRVDLPLVALILGAYLAVVGLGIAALQWYEARTTRGPVSERARLWLPIVIQFALGNLLSGYFVFYSHSGALASSWPFLLLFVGLLVGNDRLQQYHTRLVFQLASFYFVLYSFFIFYVPVALGKVGDGIFLLSGVTSVAAIALFIYLLAWVIPRQVYENQRLITGAVLAILVVINIFYFTNILPPIPLALKEAGVYRAITRIDNDYVLDKFSQTWWEKFYRYPPVRYQVGSTVYAYSAIFAPTRVHTQVVHEWQYYDETSGEWLTASRVQFAIAGGRDGGYRGYSLRSSLSLGRWRVNIRTLSGQLIGRIKFELVPTS